MVAIVVIVMMKVLF
ncbi:rCG22456 [Rattus norvegicus]|uniref:RCG22456 n=1 Tax=Rattus norvegicus TaxID=10116 RepID=A6ING2_RAT|nr:rCG22456 [Rattus norvegicus]